MTISEQVRADRIAPTRDCYCPCGMALPLARAAWAAHALVCADARAYQTTTSGGFDD